MPVTYATIEELRERAGTAQLSGSGETWLGQCIYAAERAIDHYTRRPPMGTLAYTETASAERKFNDRLSDILHPIDDLLTVSAVTRNGITVSSTEYQLHPLVRGIGPSTAIEFSVYNVSTGSTGDFYHNGVGFGQIVITGTWGFCTTANIPADIKEATLTLALWLLRKPGVKTTDLMAAMVNPNNAELTFVKGLLDPYKHYGRSLVA